MQKLDTLMDQLQEGTTRLSSTENSTPLMNKEIELLETFSQAATSGNESQLKSVESELFKVLLLSY